MLIKVKDLVPNPFRRMETYPIDREKVEGLKKSISETFFWGGIEARKRNGKYEIAFGHHRLVAIKELRLKTVDDIAVHDLTDAEMIRHMAEENLHTNKAPGVINETVLAAKDFLDAELAKCETWATSDKSIKGLFDCQRAFETAKGMGVGRDTIQKFLGSNMKAWMVQNALMTLTAIEEGTIDRKAVESLPSLEHVAKFIPAARNRNIPKKKQRDIASQIVKKGIGIRNVRSHVVSAVAVVPDDFENIKKAVETIEMEASRLRRRIQGLRAELGRLNVIELKGLKTYLAMAALSLLVKECSKIEGRK